MTESLSCTEAAIANYSNFNYTTNYTSSCSYANDACAGEWDYINFIGFYYCDIDENVAVMVAISVLFVFFAFNFFATTADYYLAPTLEIICEKLKLSPVIAGCTILAFANGAPDVISGIVAGGKSEQGLQIAIGVIFGSSLFTLTVLVATAILGAGKIDVNKTALLRDVFFLLLGIAYTSLLMYLNICTIELACGYFGIYIFYIIYVFVSEKMNAKDGEDSKPLLPVDFSVENERTKSSTLARTKPMNESLHAQSYYIKRSFKMSMSSDSKKASRASLRYPSGSMKYPSGSMKYPNGSMKNPSAALFIPRNAASGSLAPRNAAYKSEAGKSRGSLAQSDEVHVVDSVVQTSNNIEDSYYKKFVRFYNIPMTFVRDLTVPPFEEDDWNVYRAALTPIFGGAFLAWQCGLIDEYYKEIPFWAGLGATCLFFSGLIIYYGRKTNLTKKFPVTCSFITFLGATLWINLTATVFMDFLSLVAVISNLPINFLSLTLLAWGNTLGDVFVNYIIAKNGHGTMAMIGTYSGQIFNLMIGFGGALLRQTWDKTIHFDIFEFEGRSLDEQQGNILTMCLVGLDLFCLFMSVIICKWKGWTMGKTMFICVSVLYFLTIVAVTCVSFNAFDLKEY